MIFVIRFYYFYCFIIRFRKEVCLRDSSLPFDNINIPPYCDGFLKVIVLFFVDCVGVSYANDHFPLSFHVQIFEAVDLVVQGLVLLVVEGPLLIAVAEVPPFAVVRCEVFCHHGFSKDPAVLSGLF